ncbi:tetratricopeptide repeat protein [Robiginitalea sp. SC105]|uniref:tetratricopeptide repeat protein n=1 Tax=Robiginitalea sp. SC105 TaxID=2762332 RepID=UPI00163AE3F3|nr:tetratricopeptide repeat protein [Robiginitalea sp. SC105]MBC2838567.1 hypothetical protein [Robiginitalea sp. SC105]
MKTPLILLLTLALVIGCREAPEKDSTPPELTAPEYAKLGRDKLYVAWEFDAAREALLKAVEMNPEDALSHANLAWYWMLEDKREASMRHIELAKKAAPEDPLWVQWHGWICYFYDDFECAEKYLKEAIEMQPRQRDAYFTLGRMYYRIGREAEGLEYMEQAARDSTGRPARAMYLVLTGREAEAREIIRQIESAETTSLETMVLVPLYNMLGEREKALDWLEANYERRQPLLPWLRYMPINRPLHDEPRFQAMVEKIGAPSGK